MRRWIGWILQNNNRRLEVSVGGRWFLFFIIVLGVVAIYSGNNVIYLLESLLLSSLILSGILSERTIKNLNLTRQIAPATEKERVGDVFLIKNESAFPLYCVEVGEWDGTKFCSSSFILFLAGKASMRIRSKHIYNSRGEYNWQSLGVATSFPFGFAKKIRFLGASGKRIVWPCSIALASKRNRGDLLEVKKGVEVSAGEIEEVPQWGDITKVHWPSSSRAVTLQALSRKAPEEEINFFLEIKSATEELEREIRKIAYGVRVSSGSVSLTIQQGTSRRKFKGKNRCLDALALLPKAGYEV